MEGTVGDDHYAIPCLKTLGTFRQVTRGPRRPSTPGCRQANHKTIKRQGLPSTKHAEHTGRVSDTDTMPVSRRGRQGPSKSDQNNSGEPTSSGIRYNAHIHANGPSRGPGRSGGRSARLHEKKPGSSHRLSGWTLRQNKRPGEGISTERVAMSQRWYIGGGAIRWVRIRCHCDGTLLASSEGGVDGQKSCLPRGRLSLLRAIELDAFTYERFNRKTSRLDGCVLLLSVLKSMAGIESA